MYGLANPEPPSGRRSGTRRSAGTHVVREIRHVQLFELLAADGLDAERHVLQVLGALLRGDDDLPQLGGFLREYRRGAAENCRDGRSQRNRRGYEAAVWRGTDTCDLTNTTASHGFDPPPGSFCRQYATAQGIQTEAGSGGHSGGRRRVAQLDLAALARRGDDRRRG